MTEVRVLCIPLEINDGGGILGDSKFKFCHVICILVPQTVLALRGSYGVAFREGPWTGSRCTDAAGQHFPFIIIIQNQCHTQKLLCF